MADTQYNSDGREHYQLVPDSILYDHSLNGNALRVYAYLASWYREASPEIRRSIRDISKRLRMSPNTVQKCLRALIGADHVYSVGEGKVRRGYYLRSSRFHSKFSRKPSLNKIRDVPSHKPTIMEKMSAKDTIRMAYSLRKAGHKCQLCSGTVDLEVHYRVSGSKDSDDAIVLCSTCRKMHKG